MNTSNDDLASVALRYFILKLIIIEMYENFLSFIKIMKNKIH